MQHKNNMLALDEFTCTPFQLDSIKSIVESYGLQPGKEISYSFAHNASNFSWINNYREVQSAFNYFEKLNKNLSIKCSLVALNNCITTPLNRINLHRNSDGYIEITGPINEIGIELSWHDTDRDFRGDVNESLSYNDTQAKKSFEGFFQCLSNNNPSDNSITSKRINKLKMIANAYPIPQSGYQTDFAYHLEYNLIHQQFNLGHFTLVHFEQVVIKILADSSIDPYDFIYFYQKQLDFLKNFHPTIRNTRALSNTALMFKFESK